MATSANSPRRRPLADITIGISISEAESPELSALGLTSADVNDVTVELCRRLVSLGARVVLGHQWRPSGVMESVAKFAQVYQPESTDPIIHNYLAYPDRAALSAQDRQRLSGVVAIHDGEDREALPRPAALRRMREQVSKIVNARIALGGKISQPEGFLPGVIEETALTIGHGSPVYVSGMMGGTSALLTRFFRGQRNVFASIADRFEPRCVEWTNSPAFQRVLDPLADFGVLRLARHCGLEPAELEELFDANNVDTVLQLTTKGVTRNFHRN
jgi:hypothetical protein